jgi:multiple sugar transport system ATP-binding protein
VFVAAFIGTPPMNLVEASVAGDEVAFGDFRVPLDAGRRPKLSSSKVILGIRPEVFEEATLARGLPTLNVTPSVVEELGSEAHVFFPVEAEPVISDVLEKEDEATLLPESKALFAAKIDPGTRAEVGRPLELAVNPARLHFFDAETGLSLVEEPKEETVPAEKVAAAP